MTPTSKVPQQLTAAMNPSLDAILRELEEIDSHENEFTTPTVFG